MRLRIPPYLLLLLAACAGTEVGNPTFACGASDDAGAGPGGNGGIGGAGGSGGSAGEDRSCNADGSDCGLAVSLGGFNDATCPGGTSRTGLALLNVSDAPISGRVEVSDDATVEVTPDRFALEPHAGLTLAVVFSPPSDASSGRDGATLRIVLDGTPVRELEVVLDAWVDPAVRASLGVLCGNDAPCDLLDVGTVEVGETAVTPFAVVNDGCVSLFLNAPDLGPDGRLSLVEPTSFPVELPPRGRLEIRVGFAPAAPGPTGGNLTLGTDGGLERVIPWEGRGE